MFTIGPVELRPYGPVTVILLFTLAGGLIGLDIWLWPWAKPVSATRPVVLGVIIGVVVGCILTDVARLTKMVVGCWLRGDSILSQVLPLIIYWIENGTVPRVKEPASEDLDGVRYY